MRTEAVSDGAQPTRDAMHVCRAVPHFSMNFLQSIPVPLQTVLLLIASNVFMTFAWYGHLKSLGSSPWYTAALVSWGIALFEYLLQVPANRIGFTQFNVGQLKIMQEVITLGVFVVFAWLVLKEKLTWNYLVSFAFIVAAVYFATAFKPSAAAATGH